MNKKIADKNENFSKENSTVFSKPQRISNEEIKAQKSRRKKAVIALAVIIVLIFVVAPWIVVKLVTPSNKDYINDGQPKFSYSELIERVDLVNEPAKKLYGMKNPDLKETAKVQEIINMLTVDSQLGEFDIAIQNDEKPYSITFKFKGIHTVPTEGVDEWENEMRPLACAVMALIDGAAQVNWEFPNEKDEIQTGFFNRGNADEYMNLNVSIERFAESETAVQLLLNQLGIDLY